MVGSHGVPVATFVWLALLTLQFFATFPESVKATRTEFVQRSSSSIEEGDEQRIERQLVDGIVTDKINIRTEDMTESVRIQCRGLNRNKDFTLNSDETKEFSRKRQNYQDYSLCCKFHWNNKDIPYLNNLFDKHVLLVKMNAYVTEAEVIVGPLSIVTKYNGEISEVKWDERSYNTCQQPGRITTPKSVQAQENSSAKKDEAAIIVADSGRNCLSECDKRDQLYDWCYLETTNLAGRDNIAWDSCASKGYKTQSHSRVGMSSAYGIPCLTECEEGKNYFWCTTNKWRKAGESFDWDYCSPVHGTDYRGRRCTSKCDYHNRKYKWCLVQDDWGYCGDTKKKEDKDNDTKLVISGATTAARTSVIHSSYGAPCAKACTKEGNTSYYWCKTSWKIGRHDWDYCSPVKGEDYKGNTCRGPCKNEGKQYKWCYIKGGSWGYCSS